MKNQLKRYWNFRILGIPKAFSIILKVSFISVYEKISSFFWKFNLKECGSNVRLQIGVAIRYPQNITIKNNVSIGRGCKFESEFDDSLLLHEAKILFSENSVYKEFTSLQLRTSKIIAFFDEFASIGSEGEKTRFESIKEKTGAKVHKIHIITTVAGNSFYEIDGLFNGILKKQSSQSFIPLTQAKVTEIVKKGGKWFRNPVPIRSQFLGINSNSIEAIDSSIAA